MADLQKTAECDCDSMHTFCLRALVHLSTVYPNMTNPIFNHYQVMQFCLRFCWISIISVSEYRLSFILREA